MTKTKQVDEFGNVSYAVHEDGLQVATIDKTCSSYQVTLPSGDYVPVRSIRAGMDWLAMQARILARPAL